MKIRHDAVFVSSVLFTIAFLLLVPPSWHDAQAGHNKAALAHMGPGFADFAVLVGQVGVANLALILVVLIVVWKGYVNKLLWTWFVMLVVVWAWYFPLLVLPNVEYLRGFNLIKWLSSWTDFSSWSYNAPVWVLIFLLMLAALILPVRPFFSRKEDVDSQSSGHSVYQA